MRRGGVLRRRRVRLGTSDDESVSTAPTDEVGALLRLRIPLCGLAFVGGWAFVGGPFGVVAGLVVAAISWRVLGRTESPAVRRRRERLARELPIGVQLAAREGNDALLLRLAAQLEAARPWFGRRPPLLQARR